MYCIYNYYYYYYKKSNINISKFYDLSSSYISVGCYQDGDGSMNKPRAIPTRIPVNVTTANDCYTYAIQNGYDVFSTNFNSSQFWVGKQSMCDYSLYGTCPSSSATTLQNQVYIIPLPINIPSISLGDANSSPWGKCNMTLLANVTWYPGTQWIGAAAEWWKVNSGVFPNPGKYYFIKQFQLVKVLLI